MKNKKKLPGVGLRITKSAVAVALCYIVSFLRGESGIVFYSQLAALWCIQMYRENTWKNAGQRFIGTVIGALYGLIFILIRRSWSVPLRYEYYIEALVISLMIIAVIYTTVLIKKKQASYFSCVVFLSIVVNHIGDANPYLFVWNRFFDTVIGILIGIFVNAFTLPRKKRQDVLFISGLDDTLTDEDEKLSDYNRVELNRMLDAGANFTISTVRTPAALMEAMGDIRLKLPVIVMDGAALYDVRENHYLSIYVISPAFSQRIYQLVQREGLCCYSTVIIEDTLIIYYDESEDVFQQEMVNRLRRSLYRNYINRPLPENENVVYFMMFYPREIIDSFYRLLEREKITEELRVVTYNSNEHPGYAYLKIYSKNAKKENMVSYLKEKTGLSKTVTFGTIEGRYDVVVKNGDINNTVHTLKRLYEPLYLTRHAGEDKYPS